MEATGGRFNINQIGIKHAGLRLALQRSATNKLLRFAKGTGLAEEVVNLLLSKGNARAAAGLENALLASIIKAFVP